MKKFLAGFMSGILIMSSTLVFAETTQTIQAIFGRVKLVVDGKAVDKETLLYNGTTYVPLRAAAEALGKEVNYDVATQTAYIGEAVPQQQPTSVQTSQLTLPEAPLEYIHVENGKQLYKVKILGAKSMTERNKFSDKNPVQVILIDYEYENISDIEEVFISDINFKIIDSAMNTGYTYPNRITNYPQRIPVGVKCKAQMVFGVDAFSNTITLNYYDNMFNSMSKSFKIEVQ